MTRRCLIAGLFARSAAILVLGAALSARAGIPEPDLVWYGKVLMKGGGTTVRVTTGTLTWQVESLAGTPIVVLTTTLTNINDQFSFILRVQGSFKKSGLAGLVEGWTRGRTIGRRDIENSADFSQWPRLKVSAWLLEAMSLGKGLVPSQARMDACWEVAPVVSLIGSLCGG